MTENNEAPKTLMGFPVIETDFKHINESGYGYIIGSWPKDRMPMNLIKNESMEESVSSWLLVPKYPLHMYQGIWSTAGTIAWLPKRTRMKMARTIRKHYPGIRMLPAWRLAKKVLDAKDQQAADTKTAP